MKTATLLYRDLSWVQENNTDGLDYNEAQLVIGFGSGELIRSTQCYENLRKQFPKAELCLCSTAGEIFDKGVFEEALSVVAVQFSTSFVKTVSTSIDAFASSFEAGSYLIDALPKENLKWVFVLSDGSKVNGSELVKGLKHGQAEDVLISGGLAGDGTNFSQTFVGLNGVPESGLIVAIGFYGDRLQLSHGSVGGWESFGMEREVTKARKNILFKIDGKKALDLYKTYLGKYAYQLPSASLLFPLALKVSNTEQPIVRTILSVNEKNQSMTFAGDIPEGSKVRFMKANFDRLVDAASDAASQCVSFRDSKPKLAFLISCVGRKMVLGNRIDEEIEAVSEMFNHQTVLTGFYSYGEIAPTRPFAPCELHNQTMTITGITELV